MRTAPDHGNPGPMIDLDADATELARRVREKEVSAEELTNAAIAAIEAVNPKLNAVVHAMYDAARATAKAPLPGPFSGVPAVVKDFDGFVEGVPWTASCKFLDGYIPDHDSENIARLRRAGLVFLAKTNCPELAILGTTEPEWRGPTRNPWNTDHSVGGSSGGSAALVASGAVSVGHGGDGGGSLRIPGSACGIVGFKASRGRISLAPDQGEGWGGYVQTGVLVRSVRDAAAFLDVLAGPMPGDPYAAPAPARPFIDEVGAPPGKLRIAMTTRSLFGKDTDPECVKAVEETAKLLSDLGHHVEDAMPPFDRDKLVLAYLTQVAVGVATEIEDFARMTGKTPSADAFEASTWFLRQVGHTITGIEMQQARDAIHEASRKLGAFFEKYDVLLLPTLAHPPVKIGQLKPKPAELFGLSMLRAVPMRPAIRAVLSKLAADNFERTPNTQLFNQTGQPAISLPLHQSADGLPIGVQLVGRYGDEATILRVSAQLESARPWRDRRPAISAPRS